MMCSHGIFCLVCGFWVLFSSICLFNFENVFFWDAFNIIILLMNDQYVIDHFSGSRTFLFLCVVWIFSYLVTVWVVLFSLILHTRYVKIARLPLFIRRFIFALMFSSYFFKEILFFPFGFHSASFQYYFLILSFFISPSFLVSYLLFSFWLFRLTSFDFGIFFSRILLPIYCSRFVVVNSHLHLLSLWGFISYSWCRLVKFYSFFSRCSIPENLDHGRIYSYNSDTTFRGSR